MIVKVDMQGLDREHSGSLEGEKEGRKRDNSNSIKNILKIKFKN